MSSNESTPKAEAGTGKWIDAEKIALLVSVLNDLGGTPNWKNVTIPAGRTLGTSRKIFAQLKKDAASVAMTSEDAIRPATKRGTKKASGKADGDGSSAKITPKKHGRKAEKVDREDAPSPNEDEEEGIAKKVKVERGEEDGDVGMDEEGEVTGEEA